MSQKSKILSYLKGPNRTITGLQALHLFGCYRLSARIEELRGMGHRIQTDMVEYGKKRVARYRMVA